MTAGAVPLAFVAGVLSAAASEHRFGPAALAGGLSVSFVVIGLFAATIGYSIGLDVGVFRNVAAMLMIAIGAILLVPPLQTLSDVGQKVGRAFGLVYTFSDELKRAYQAFGRDIPATNGADEWALPISATYIIGRDGTIIYAYTDPDYRDRADPEEVLLFLKEASVPAESRRPKRKVG